MLRRLVTLLDQHFVTRVGTTLALVGGTLVVYQRLNAALTPRFDFSFQGGLAATFDSSGPSLSATASHAQFENADEKGLAGIALQQANEELNGERFELDAGVTLTAIHTPGHASNHLCYRLDEEKTLFTGDHVMQLSTVVINPPDGDMAAYLSSLVALQSRGLRWLAPGHGFLVAEPNAVLQGLVAHRLRREAKVLAALQALREGSTDDLLPRVYDDVPAALHAVARRSLLAHLIKLQQDGRAQSADGQRWSSA